MLQRLLALQVTDALLLQQQARGLEAFQRVFGVRRDLAAPAVGRCAERQHSLTGGTGVGSGPRCSCT